MARSTKSKRSAAPAKPAQRQKADAALRPARRSTAQSGRIITFYSYKGGTGRTMALANVAWILASVGRRVLVIDWDLEAPGLHQYFRPFLPDPDLSQTPGLINFFATFAEAARLQERSMLLCQLPSQAWYTSYANLRRYAVPLNYEFSPSPTQKEPGCLDFVPAGRQGPSYGVLIESFDWTEFYEGLGGGIFLQAVRQELRKHYDYIFVDSRTGHSDTSGICTIQMPDELVVLFTLNRQSIYGAAAAARSANEQRRGPKGETRLIVWPVMTRVDPSEHERLAGARAMARQRFGPFLKQHMNKVAQEEYWEGAEIPYRAFYAYEEILATIGDAPRNPSSLLAAMERLTRAVTKDAPSGLRKIDELERLRLLSLYTAIAKRADLPPIPRIYLSYGIGDFPTGVMAKIAERLQKEFGDDNVIWDAKIPLGKPWEDYLNAELERSEFVLFFVGPKWLTSSSAQGELKFARDKKKFLVPIVLNDLSSWKDVPDFLRSSQGVEIEARAPEENMEVLVQRLRSAISAETIPQPGPMTDPDDPQKHRWGGLAVRNGRRLDATVEKVSDTWFEITVWISVERGGKPLHGTVDFHLHSSFDSMVKTVNVEDEKASLVLHAYGAFTIGAVADGGRTFLELDLSTLLKAPKYFREH